MAETNEFSGTTKWYNRWWGIFFLLILTAGILCLAAFIYNVVYYAEELSSENKSAKSGLLPQIETADDPALGSKLAGITIVEFSDFQCPFCLEAFPIVKKLAANYPDDVRIIYRDFPNLAIHDQAVSAALAANCAKEQDKFWEYHDLLFANQSDLSEENLKLLAERLNLDLDKFNQCFSSQKYLNEIQNDLQDGLKLGITGTPTFFINGYKLPGGVISYEAFKALIEKYQALGE